MQVKINRVAVAVHDVRAAIKTYERLLNCKFHRAGEAVSSRTGLSVAASWEGCMEIISPLPGSDKPNAQAVRRFLEERGEGIYGVCYEVDDLDQADARAEGEKLPLLMKLKFTDAEIDQELGGLYSRFEESVYDGAETLGFTIAYNVLERKKSGVG
jgi:methylmalonyl-CoA/ethylmalonyl-CoA epimerase